MLYIFDMGGVVVKDFDVFPQIVKELRISIEKFYEIAGENYLLLSNGMIDTMEFWAEFSKDYGSKVREELFGKYFAPKLNCEVVEIIRKLKRQARVVCGTNTLEPHFKYHRNRGDYQIFHTVYASNRIGISKPNPDFYRYILDKEKALPAETVFIDDTEENIFAANTLGIKAILFTTPEALKKELVILNKGGIKP
jgi:putative hydrolase of the HAD superfamily